MMDAFKPDRRPAKHLPKQPRDHGLGLRREDVALLGVAPRALNHLSERSLVLVDLLRGRVLGELRQRILELPMNLDVRVDAFHESLERLSVRVHRPIRGGLCARHGGRLALFGRL